MSEWERTTRTSSGNKALDWGNRSHPLRLLQVWGGGSDRKKLAKNHECHNNKHRMQSRGLPGGEFLKPGIRDSYQWMAASCPRRAERRSALDSVLSGLLELELSMMKTLAMSVCSTQRIWPALRLALFVACWISLSLVAEAAWEDDIGLTKLRETLGDQMLTGQGVFISQVEAEQGQVSGKFFPDPNGLPFNAALAKRMTAKMITWDNFSLDKSSLCDSN